VGDNETLSGDYALAHESPSSLAVSRWIVRHTDVAALVQRRRQRYAEWADAVAALPGCRALFPALPPQCTPYMFALLVERQAERFHPRSGAP
jgi:perosamine synthetase